MLLNNRVIWKNNATLEDLTISLNDLFAGSKVVDIVAADDKLYLGSQLPFNHRFFQVSVVNALASVVTVEIWDGSAWNAAVDVLDLTAVSGATLAQSGVIQWAVDRNKSFGLAQTTEDVTGLTTLKIYNMYWVRLTFSANLTGTTALSYIGHKFSNDSMLSGLGYPDLVRSAVLSAYATGKTTWNDQHILASEIVVRDLVKSGHIKSGSQILGWDQFGEASAHKCAEIAFTAFGEKKENERLLAAENYKAAMNQISFPDLDKDADGVPDSIASVGTRVWMRR